MLSSVCAGDNLVTLIRFANDECKTLEEDDDDELMWGKREHARRIERRWNRLNLIIVVMIQYTISHSAHDYQTIVQWSDVISERVNSNDNHIGFIESTLWTGNFLYWKSKRFHYVICWRPKARNRGLLFRFAGVRYCGQFAVERFADKRHSFKLY